MFGPLVINEQISLIQVSWCVDFQTLGFRQKNLRAIDQTFSFLLRGQTVFVITLGEVRPGGIFPRAEIAVHVAFRPVLRWRAAELWPALIVPSSGEGWPKSMQSESFAARLTPIGVR